MKKLLVLLLLTTNLTFSQTIIRYDRMETWDWAGTWWTPAATAGWFTNASVSSAESAALYGLGSGTSTIEQDWYSLPNVTGLDPTKQYRLQLRLASYVFSNPTASTRGVDVADYVSVQISTNGGTSYVTELRITGNSNATWPYTSTGTIIHTANGVFTNSAAPTGDVYQSPAGASTNGPSTIILDLPIGINQVAVDIYCRINSAGEEWWIDNIELWDMAATSLPVELMTFEGQKTDEGNVITWSTATEHNSSHFLLERSTTGEFTEKSVIAINSAAGNSVEVLDYFFLDKDYQNTINYYRLTQVDNDGKYREYGPIAIDNRVKSRVTKYVNMLGQVVDPTTQGILFEIYEDGTSKKIIR
jgi:hypothetical protein